MKNFLNNFFINLLSASVACCMHRTCPKLGFANFRQHRQENPSRKCRIHFVCSSAIVQFFWLILVLSAVWSLSMTGRDEVDLTWRTDNGQLYGNSTHLAELVAGKMILRFYIFPATTFSKVSRQLARFLSIYFTRGTNLLEEKESCNNVNGCKSPSLALLFLNEESSPIIPEEWFEALGYPKVLPTNIWEKAFFYIFWHLMNTHMIRVYG